MKKEHLAYLVCPTCKGPLELKETHVSDDGSVEGGQLTCGRCNVNYPIVWHIPRFVPMQNYADNFGLEWMIHARTQHDTYSGSDVSERRFFEETKWPGDLSGQTILEVGSGSGRFTVHAASTGAMVVSMDYSNAVEANYASNGGRDNVLIVQGDLYRMPFPEGCFDKVICIGVLQHTPDVKKAFMTLPRYLREGGDLVVDFYRKLAGFKSLLAPKFWVRPLTTRMDPVTLYKVTSAYVRFMWPITGIIGRLPKGRGFNWQLLVADYRGVYDMDDRVLREWAILDTYDMLSPAYDQPQTLETVQQWFREADLEEIDVHYGYNGIEGRGRQRSSGREQETGQQRAGAATQTQGTKDASISHGQSGTG